MGDIILGANLTIGFLFSSGWTHAYCTKQTLAPFSNNTCQHFPSCLWEV